MGQKNEMSVHHYTNGIEPSFDSVLWTVNVHHILPNRTGPLISLVELKRFELSTSRMRTERSPN